MLLGLRSIPVMRKLVRREIVLIDDAGLHHELHVLSFTIAALAIRMRESVRRLSLACESR